ncbi:MAG: DUF4331 domain-containing protein [Acidobacteria bacterium]|nr:DUF4331 domain-containing protein [Acidobacteriota bacterium]MCA1619919.1 DUF4331 domain-containing protein [Acidobacteriota bacterium]
MGRFKRLLSLVAALGLLAAAFSAVPGLLPAAEASSHREAPLISADPLADNTDVYAFVSPDRANTVTILANFIPFEEPAGGPNFFKFDDNVLYQIRFDNNGDAAVDLVLEFRFRTVVGNGDTFLYNGDFDNNGEGTINNLSDPDFNVKQFMDVQARIRQGSSFTTFTLGTNLPTPPVNIGPRSTPNYETNLAEPAISTVPTGAGDIKLFAGQRDEGFYIDVGSIFDLVGLRPFNSAHLAPLPTSNGVDGTAGYNVHTIAIQVPTQLLTATGQLPTGASDPNAIIGVYSTASRPSTRVLNTNGTQTQTGNCAAGQGIPGADASCVQVSRLANPLFNELFIPMGTSPTVSENDKDLYNAQLPATDINRIDFVRGTAGRPVEPVKLINQLYPPVLDAPTSGRNDLVRVFLTGVPGATRPPVQNDPADPGAGPGAVPSDLMRLNVAVPATAPGSVNRLGVIAGDLGGYPNGRRVGDDTVDITLRVAAGVLLPGNACAGGTASCNQAPNNQLGDGVTQNDKPFRTTFPYLATPWSGYENPFHGRECSNTPDAPCPTPSPTPRP